MENTQLTTTIPATVASVLKSNGAPVRMLQFVADRAGIKLAKGAKSKDVKAAVGEDKFKALKAEFNSGKAEFHVWSSKVAALAVADPSQRKETRIVKNANGVLLGMNIKTRFVKDAATSALTLAQRENADLRARLAALEAAALPAS